jgi:predicted nucleotidyltransferase component of viral defense system
MSKAAMSLKAQIRNLAKKKNVKAQVLLQNYMFERFLARMSLSEYRDKIVLKGGALIAAIVGMDARATMDLDAMLRGLPLSEEGLRDIVNTICSVELQDDVILEVGVISPIRHDDVYGGYRVKIKAYYDTIETPFAVDFSTGDVITPSPVKYSIEAIFDAEKKIELWAYNLETIMAEKIETVLRRSTLNTRARDFYDIYILGTTQIIDKTLLKQAIAATAAHRGTTEQIADVPAIVEEIRDSTELRMIWEKYRREFDYATGISYEQAIEALRGVCEKIAAS